jgi:hypothetical protein
MRTTRAGGEPVLTVTECISWRHREFRFDLGYPALRIRRQNPLRPDRCMYRVDAHGARPPCPGDRMYRSLSGPTHTIVTAMWWLGVADFGKRHELAKYR